MRLRTDTNVTSHDTYAIRGHESDRSHVTHAANRCKPLHSHECGNHPQRSSACSGIDSSCILAPLHFHACKSRTRPCRTVSKHTMRARTCTDWQAYTERIQRARRARRCARCPTLPCTFGDSLLTCIGEGARHSSVVRSFRTAPSVGTGN